MDPRSFARSRCEKDRHHFPLHRLARRRPEMADLKDPSPAICRPDGKRFRHEARLGRRRSLEHRAPARPHPSCAAATTTARTRHRPRLHQGSGMRARAQRPRHPGVGPRTDLDIRRTLERQVEAERWTQLDRQLVRDGGHEAWSTSCAGEQPDEFHVLKIGRPAHAGAPRRRRQVGKPQWVRWRGRGDASANWGERGDIIKRMHGRLTERGIERGRPGLCAGGEGLGARRRPAGRTRPG